MSSGQGSSKPPSAAKWWVRVSTLRRGRPMFRKVLAGKRPAYGAVVFDAPGRSFRVDIDPAYCEALSRVAAAGVEVRAFTTKLEETSFAIHREIPVDLPAEAAPRKKA